MAFSVVSKKSGKTYYLHAREQELKGGKTVTLYYFAGDARDNAIDSVACARYRSQTDALRPTTPHAGRRHRHVQREKRLTPFRTY